MRSINLINDGVHTLRQVVDRDNWHANVHLIVPRDWINREIRKARVAGYSIRDCDPVNLIAQHMMPVRYGVPGQWYAEIPERKHYQCKLVDVERSDESGSWVDQDVVRRRIRARRFLVFTQYGAYDV